jgi:hypothetical protein
MQPGIEGTRPELASDEHILALYPFDEHTGSIVWDNARSWVELCIPEKV